jgi:hypothetical protein
MSLSSPRVRHSYSRPSSADGNSPVGFYTHKTNVCFISALLFTDTCVFRVMFMLFNRFFLLDSLNTPHQVDAILLSEIKRYGIKGIVSRAEYFFQGL